MINTKAFAGSTISVDRSMSEIDKLLAKYGVRENRYTHVRPERVGAAGDAGRGALVYEFVWPERGAQERRGVRIVVTYREEVGPKGGRAGVTAEQAGRALFWHLKSKFDSIEFGIEDCRCGFHADAERVHRPSSARTTGAAAKRFRLADSRLRGILNANGAPRRGAQCASGSVRQRQTLREHFWLPLCSPCLASSVSRFLPPTLGCAR